MLRDMITSDDVLSKAMIHRHITNHIWLGIAVVILIAVYYLFRVSIRQAIEEETWNRITKQSVRDAFEGVLSDIGDMVLNGCLVYAMLAAHMVYVETVSVWANAHIYADWILALIVVFFTGKAVIHIADYITRPLQYKKE